MKPKIVAFVCAALIGATQLVAQPPQGKMYLLHQEAARPSMLKAYENTAQEFAALVKAHRSVMPHFSYTTLMGDDFTYTYVAPIANLGTIDSINAEFGALAQAAGAPFGDLTKRAGSTVDAVKEWVLQEAPELSYTPANPRLKFDDMRFFHYDLYYLQYGREEDANAIAKDFLALFKAKNAPGSYRIFKAVLGGELPLLVVEVGAKDAADYANADAQMRTLIGDEGKALFARAFGVTRRFETKSAWLRPDLSLPPAPPTTEKQR